MQVKQAAFDFPTAPLPVVFALGAGYDNKTMMGLGEEAGISGCVCVCVKTPGFPAVSPSSPDLTTSFHWFPAIEKLPFAASSLLCSPWWTRQEVWMLQRSHGVKRVHKRICACDHFKI